MCLCWQEIDADSWWRVALTTGSSSALWQTTLSCVEIQQWVHSPAERMCQSHRPRQPTSPIDNKLWTSDELLWFSQTILNNSSNNKNNKKLWNEIEKMPKTHVWLAHLRLERRFRSSETMFLATECDKYVLLREMERQEGHLLTFAMRVRCFFGEHQTEQREI